MLFITFGITDNNHSTYVQIGRFDKTIFIKTDTTKNNNVIQIYKLHGD